MMGTTTSPVWEMFVDKDPTVAPKANTSWGSVLDLNGDGLADLAVGGSGDAVEVFLGSKGTSWTPPSPITIQGASGSGVGITVASAGDLNGDGLSDLIVGSGANAAYVYMGAAGSSWTPPSAIPIPGPGGSNGFADSTGFGNTVATAGDLNGDGLADLVVGARKSGTAYVYLGATGATWAPGAPIPLSPPSGAAGTFGLAVAGAGDLNGDGLGDLAVSAPGDGSTTIGMIAVYRGVAGGTWTPTTPITITPPSPFQYDDIVASGGGDVNGDGLTDLIVGDVSDTMAFLYPGAMGSTVGTGVKIVPSVVARNFGEILSGVGDLNGDGLDDFAVGDSDDNETFVYLGAAGTTWTPPAAIPIPGPTPGAGGVVFQAIATAGDINGDALDDLAIGCADLGAGLVLLGEPGAGWVPPAGIQLSGPNGFGITIAWEGWGPGRPDGNPLGPGPRE
jgi:hypothetical protein